VEVYPVDKESQTLTDEDVAAIEAATGGKVGPPGETPEQAADRIEGKAQPIRAEIVAAYESMLANVPDAGDSGFERILEAIAAAGDVSQLDAPWRSEGLLELAGIPLTVRGITKIPSDYPGGLPWFLVVDAVNEVTGKPLTVTTGAIGPVAQLVKGWALGAFPLKVTPRVAERPSKSGYFPMHLEVRG
jgi:hypothetical protein